MTQKIHTAGIIKQQGKIWEAEEKGQRLCLKKNLKFKETVIT